MRFTTAIVVDFVASLVFAGLFAVSWGFGSRRHVERKVGRRELGVVKPRLCLVRGAP